MQRLMIVLLIVLSNVVFAQKTIEKIVAIVDSDVILESELNYQILLAAQRSNLDPTDASLKIKVLNALIDEKLLYAQAEIDSIEVTDDEINRQIDYQVNYFKEQYGSQERLEEAYGMPLEKIKRELKDQTKKQMMAQRVREQKLRQADVTRKEVEEFFVDYKDSLGTVPEKFSISHIFINPKADEKVKLKTKIFVDDLLDSLKSGADFEALAKRYSDDPGSAAKGGNLGWVKRGVFYPEFESAAFALKPNTLSKVIESPVGFHIIELLDRRGESIHCRHILVKLKADDEGDIKAIQFLSDLRDSITREKNTFEYYAKKYSDDKQTASFGGDLGSFEVGQLDKNLKEQVYQLKEGELSFPKRLEVDKSTYGFHIIKLVKHSPEHLPSIEQDYEEIKKLAEYSKNQKTYTKWLKELRDKIYWELKI